MAGIEPHGRFMACLRKNVRSSRVTSLLNQLLLFKQLKNAGKIQFAIASPLVCHV